MTTKEMITALSAMPGDAEIFVSCACFNGPMSVIEFTARISGAVVFPLDDEEHVWDRQIYRAKEYDISTIGSEAFRIMAETSGAKLAVVLDLPIEDGEMVAVPVQGLVTSMKAMRTKKRK